MSRYQRQEVLPGFGTAAQEKLTAARVVVIGCGGLGGPAATYLGAAGVGHLVLVDGDVPEVSNLHRQPFFHDNGMAKTQQLAFHLGALNPEIKVTPRREFLGPHNVRDILSGADLVLECTDDAATKHLVNDACHLLQIPLAYAAAQGYSGYLALFPMASPDAITLRDLYPEPDPSLPDCATTGVLPTAVGIVALLQANAALCFLTGLGDPPVDTLLTYSALDNRQHRLRLRKTYVREILPPWRTPAPTRAELETDATAGFDTIFTMLDARREPAPAAGTVRLTKRDPLGQCLRQMEVGKRYLIYCNSGKLSLVLAGQLRKENPDLAVFSLRGGLTGGDPPGQ